MKCIVVFLAAIASSTAIIPASQYPNIIVIGDMHGDAQALLLSLYSGYVEIVEKETENPPVSFNEFRLRFDHVIGTQTLHKFGPLWNQKNVAVVQLGDLIDRGPYSLKCLLIMRAVRAVIGFEVFQILGNHELAAAIDVTAMYTKYRHPADDFNWNAPSESIHKPFGLLYSEIMSKFLPFVRLDGGLNREISTLFVHAGVQLEFVERHQDDSISVQSGNFLLYSRVENIVSLIRYFSISFGFAIWFACISIMMAIFRKRTRALGSEVRSPW